MSSVHRVVLWPGTLVRLIPAGREMSLRPDRLLTVWSSVVSGCVRSSRWFRRISAVGSAFVCPISTAHPVLPEVSSYRFVLPSSLSRAWSVAFLLDFFVCSFVRFPSVSLVWSVASLGRRLVSVVSSLVASGSRSFRNSRCVSTMSDNVEEITPVSPSASAPMSGVTAAPASSVQPVAASADPTMVALFDIVRARSSSSVAPPPSPVTTPSCYVSFTGTVRRSIGVDTHEPEGVIVEPATSSDRLLTSIPQRTDWAECARIKFSWDDLRESQRSEIVRIRQVAESVGASANVQTGRYLDLVEGAFVIPPPVRCDRIFLLYGSDAKYVESVERYLFEGDVAYPGLAERSLRDVLVRSGDVRAWKTSYSVTNGSRSAVPYRDFFVLWGKLAHAYDVMMAGRPQNRTLLMLPFSRFPSLPVEFACALPPQGLSVRIPSSRSISRNASSPLPSPFESATTSRSSSSGPIALPPLSR